MLVTVSGYRSHSKRLVKLMEDASEFFASKMMRKDLVENIDLEIIIAKDLAKKEGVQGSLFGYCTILDDRLSRPREFQIEICAGKRITKMLLTLAHEMTHLKQFARKELRNYQNGSTTWCGKSWSSKREKKIGHWKLPWEDEAYEKELELFMELVNTTDILDDYIDKR